MEEGGKRRRRREEAKRDPVPFLGNVIFGE